MSVIKKTIQSLLYTTSLLLPAVPFAATLDAGSLLNQQNELRQLDRVPQKPQPTIDTVAPVDNQAPSEATVTIQSIQFQGGETQINRDALNQLTQAYLNKPVSFAKIKYLTDRITSFIKAEGYLLGFAYIPNQEMANGNLIMNIMLGKLDGGKNGIVIKQKDVRLKKGVAQNIMNHALLKDKNHTIYNKHLERGLLLVNDLPGIQADATLKAGEQSGTTQIEVNVTEGKRLVPSASIDNFGNRYTGRARLNAQLQINNPSKIGDQLNVNVTKTKSSEQLYLRYERPIKHDGLMFNAHTNFLNYRLGQELSNLDAKGRSFNIGAALTYPFVRTRNHNLYGSVQVEKRNISNSILGTPTQDRRLNTYLATLYGNMHHTAGAGGQTSFHTALSAGNVNLNDIPAVLQNDQATARTHGAYQKLAFDMTSIQYLNHETSLLGRVKTQYTNQNLDSSEKFFLGGPTGVRAYPIGEATGDRGWLINLEARHDIHLDASAHHLQVNTFFDVGGIQQYVNTWQNAITNAEGKNSYLLKGFGFGANYRYQNQLSISASIAKAIGHNPGRDLNGNNSDGEKDNLQFWLQGNLWF